MFVAARQQGMKKTGMSVTLKNDDFSRLSYYLHCVTKGVGIDILPDKITDYRNASNLSRDYKDAILKLAYEALSPDTTVGKVLYPDQDGLCGSSDNEFYEVTQVDTVLAVASSVVLGGKQTKVAKIMVFKKRWLDRSYHQPIKNQMRRIKQICDVKDDTNDVSDALAKLLLVGLAASLTQSSDASDEGVIRNTMHCHHCRGLDGSCGCNHGCPIKTETKCSKVHHCDHCKGFDGKCTCTHGCAEGIYSKCRVEHTRIICDGCRQQNIKGCRFKCTTCSNFDLCEMCYNQGSRKHDMTHPFARIDRVGSNPVRLAARQQRAPPRPRPTPPAPTAPACPAVNPAYQRYEPPKVVVQEMEPPIVTATPIPATTSLDEFIVGDTVQLVGLVGAAHLNGATAMVERNAPMAGGRIQVRLSEGTKEPGKVTCIKPENLIKTQVFQKGQMVALQGLGKQEMNGITGMVESCFPTAGRVQVCLYEGKTVSIKPENLRVIADILD